MFLYFLSSTEHRSWEVPGQKIGQGGQEISMAELGLVGHTKGKEANSQALEANTHGLRRV